MTGRIVTLFSTPLTVEALIRLWAATDAEAAQRERIALHRRRIGVLVRAMLCATTERAQVDDLRRELRDEWRALNRLVESRSRP